MIQQQRKPLVKKVMETFGKVTETDDSQAVTTKAILGNEEISRLNKLAVEEGATIALKRSGAGINISVR
ncbi:MAG: hypothetical protein AB3N16_07890 [Flavobacteriaceae bacterium]